MKKRGIDLGKKSQTALFIILGIIIIIGGAVFFSLTNQTKERFEPEIKIAQEQIPLEFDQIRKYANDCAYSAGAEGLKILGKQGGHISLTDKTLDKESFTITRNPTESDAVSFGDELKIPYWWYMKSANKCSGDCSYASKRPDLRNTENSIEKQLERYVTLKFKECVNNFEPFRSQGFKISETGKIKTDVTISTDDVLVLVEYPLSIELQGSSTAISQFFASIPVSLDRVYELAAKITNLEMKHRFLEKHVMNLIAAFSGTNKQLPPMSDMQFGFGTSKSWQKREVKEKITGLMASYIPLFQVDGTYNYERNVFDTELKQRLYDSTIIPVANSSFRDLSAYFTYLDVWPAYFDLNCNGERCIPSSANSLISFFGIQDYRFAYDVSFPVLVEVIDPFAFSNQGYTFRFFLEGNVRNNKAMPVNFNELQLSFVSGRSQLCDARTSGNVTVYVTNKATKKPIDDAHVLYSVTDESCFIGSTSSNGIMREIFPAGSIGGAVNVVKEDFIGKSVEFDARLDRDDSIKVELQPVYIKNLVVKKKKVVKRGDNWIFESNPVDLSAKETATIILARTSDFGELDFSAVANYEGQQKATEIQIAPGTYSADINLILDERIVIPEKEKCFKGGLNEDKKCYKTPKIDFAEKSQGSDARFLEGGLKLNFTISPRDLENSNTIVLYAVAVDFSSVPESERDVGDIEHMGRIEEYSQIYQLSLQPEFKK